MMGWESIAPVEVHELRCKTHRANIRLAEVPEGWAWAVDYARLFGDYLGRGEPLGRWDGALNPRRLAPSREAAIEAAQASIRAAIPDAPMSEWLDRLTPAQRDLFGEAA